MLDVNSSRAVYMTIRLGCVGNFSSKRCFFCCYLICLDFLFVCAILPLFSIEEFLWCGWLKITRIVKKFFSPSFRFLCKLRTVKEACETCRSAMKLSMFFWHIIRLAQSEFACVDQSASNEFLDNFYETRLDLLEKYPETLFSRFYRRKRFFVWNGEPLFWGDGGACIS